MVLDLPNFPDLPAKAFTLSMTIHQNFIVYMVGLLTLLSVQHFGIIIEDPCTGSASGWREGLCIAIYKT